MISENINLKRDVPNYESYFTHPWDFPVESVFPEWQYCGYSGVRRITFINYSYPSIFLEVLPSGDYNFEKTYSYNTNLIFSRPKVNPLIKGLINKYKNGAHTNFYFDLGDDEISVYKFGTLIREGDFIEKLPRDCFPKTLDSLQLHKGVITVCFKSKDLLEVLLKSGSFMRSMSYLDDSLPLNELLEHSKERLNPSS